MANRVFIAVVTLTLASFLLPMQVAYSQTVSQTVSQAEPPAESQGTPSNTPGNNQSRQIEQITVVGERTLLSMRNEIERIEEQLYDTFNALNKSDEFDIFCVTETRTTSHIMQRSCEPVFLTNLKKENAQHAVSQIRNAYTDEGLDFVLLEYGLDFIESEKTLKSQASAQYEELSQEILRIAQENPDYRDALLRIGNLKAEYELARREKFGSR